MEIIGYHDDGWLGLETFIKLEAPGSIQLDLFLPAKNLPAEKNLLAIVNGEQVQFPVERGKVVTLALPPKEESYWTIALISDQPEEESGVDRRALGFVLIDVRRDGESILSQVTANRSEYRSVDIESHIGHKSIVATALDRSFYQSQLAHGHDLRFPELHYLLVGWKQGYDPNADFSTTKYLDLHRDVAEAGVNPFYHYLTEGKREGREIAPSSRTAFVGSIENKVSDAGEGINVVATLSPHFDVAFYREQLGVHGEEIANPILHYVSEGWRLGLDPTPSFSTKYYLDGNPDVAASGINPFFHYLVEGRRHGRMASHPGGDLFRDLLKVKPLEDQVEEWLNWAPSDFDLKSQLEIKKILAHQIGTNFSKLVVSVCHDDYRSTPGGIQLCIQREQELARAAGFHYLAIFPARPIPRLLSRQEYGESVVGVVISGDYVGRVKAEDLVAAVSEIRCGDSAAAVIVHQLMGQAPEFVAKMTYASGAKKVFFWIHDYFSLCPSYALQRNGIKYCGGPKVTSNSCRLCLYGQERRSHQQRFEQMFRTLDIHVISPSMVALRIWEERFGVEPTSKSLLPHLKVDWKSEQRRVRGTGRDFPIHLAFTGTIARIKGWNTFERLARRYSASQKFKFSVLSMQKPGISTVNHEAVHVQSHDKTMMIRKLRELSVDFVIHWAGWPETFSLSAYEAIASGAFVLTNCGSGNVAAHVLETGRGMVFEREESLLEFLEGDEITELSARIRSERSRFEAEVAMSNLTFGFIEPDLN